MDVTEKKPLMKLCHKPIWSHYYRTVWLEICR